MNKITVSTQEQLDAIPDDYDGDIHIVGELDNFTKCYRRALVYVHDNAVIRSVRGNANITYLYDNAIIDSMCGYAMVSNAYGKAKISHVFGSATVCNICGDVEINDIHGSADIHYVSGNARLNAVYGQSRICHVSGNATIRGVFDYVVITGVFGDAKISHVYDHVEIKNIFGNAEITRVSGDAHILRCFGKVSIQTCGDNIITYYRPGSGVKINASPKTAVIPIGNYDNPFDAHIKTYPAEIIDVCAIFYIPVLRESHNTFTSLSGDDMKFIIGEERESNQGISVSGMYDKMEAIRETRFLDGRTIIQVKVPLEDAITSKPNTYTGLMVTSRLTVVREVPEDEWYI